MSETYEETLRRIIKRDREHAYHLFQCLVVSKRPLLVEELAEILTIQTSVETIPTFNADWRYENPEDAILSTCSALVAVVNVDDKKIVQFSHLSVSEYLVSERIAKSEHVPHFHILPRPAHAHLARACLGVLLQLDDRVVWDDIGNSPGYPLSSYAAEFWVDHAQFENVSSDIRRGMECLFDRNRPHFAAWLWLHNMDDSSWLFMAAVHHARPLYYAALCGFRDIADHLLDAHPQDVNGRGGKRVTPLHAAVDKGHLDVAILLLERGADMESRDCRNRTPLHIASHHGYTEVVTLLINRGADPNAEAFNQRTPLHFALEMGHNKVVRLLFDHGADANHPDNHDWTPLRLALERGHEEIIQWLLDHGADANQPGDRHRTLLHHASLRGHKNNVQLLLDHGAITTCADNRGWTPLHHTSFVGDNDVVQILLNHGAVANYPDNRDRTPLHLASRRGHDEIVRLLLDWGADANRADNSGWSPLQYALREGHNDIVKLLLDRCAVVGHQDNCD